MRPCPLRAAPLLRKTPSRYELCGYRRKRTRQRLQSRGRTPAPAGSTPLTFPPSSESTPGYRDPYRSWCGGCVCHLQNYRCVSSRRNATGNLHVHLHQAGDLPRRAARTLAVVAAALRNSKRPGCGPQFRDFGAVATSTRASDSVFSKPRWTKSASSAVNSSGLRSMAL